jgi:SAM-dependent methyltransferase
MDFSETVKAGYNGIVDPYLAQRDGSTPDVRLLDLLIARLTPGAAVLDAGCGAGVPITRRLAESFQVTGVDFAEAQLAQARRLVPTARFVCADLRAPVFADGAFDAICSYYAIIHIPREDHAALFRGFARLLKPGGLALLCVGADDLPYSQETYFGVPMAWSHFDAATNRRLIEAGGLQIEWAERVPDGWGPASHLFVLARRPLPGLRPGQCPRMRKVEEPESAKRDTDQRVRAAALPPQSPF